MIKTLKRNYFENGQVIPIVVISIIAIIAFAALIVDGGGLLLNRRYAQNAADAGALAGARVLCNESNPDSSSILDAITQYTTSVDNTTVIDWYITDDNLGQTPGLQKGEVVVVVEVENDPFFAGIFNLVNSGEDHNSLTAQATAAAGCFSQGFESTGPVMPFMYPCNPPLVGSDSQNCDFKSLSWQDIQNTVQAAGCGVTFPLTNKPNNAQSKCINDALFETYPDYVYIVMDDSKLCKDPLDPKYENFCKITPDGRYQLNSSQRGWLNLNGGNAGNSNVTCSINGNCTIPKTTHTWYSTIPGNRTRLYTDMEKHVFDIVSIPIVNKICNYKPTQNSACWKEALADFPLPPGGSVSIVDGSPGQNYAHVIAYVPFIPTCFRNKSNDCPSNAITSLSSAKYTVEGYFIRPDSLGGDSISTGGFDLGLYLALLTQ